MGERQRARRNARQRSVCRVGDDYEVGEYSIIMSIEYYDEDDEYDEESIMTKSDET